MPTDSSWRSPAKRDRPTRPQYSSVDGRALDAIRDLWTRCLRLSAKPTLFLSTLCTVAERALALAAGTLDEKTVGYVVRRRQSNLRGCGRGATRCLTLHGTLGLRTEQGGLECEEIVTREQTAAAAIRLLGYLETRHGVARQTELGSYLNAVLPEAPSLACVLRLHSDDLWRKGDYVGIRYRRSTLGGGRTDVPLPAPKPIRTAETAEWLLERLGVEWTDVPRSTAASPPPQLLRPLPSPSLQPPNRVGILDRRVGVLDAPAGSGEDRSPNDLPDEEGDYEGEDDASDEDAELDPDAAGPRVDTSDSLFSVDGVENTMCSRNSVLEQARTLTYIGSPFAMSQLFPATEKHPCALW